MSYQIKRYHDNSYTNELYSYDNKTAVEGTEQPQTFCTILDIQ